MIGARSTFALPVGATTFSLGPFADPMTGSGWDVTVSGTGARTWTGGTCVFTCTNAGVGSARIEQAGYQPADSWEFLARARTDTTSGSANEQVYLLGGGSIASYVGLASLENNSLVAFWGDPYAALATVGGPTLLQRQSGLVWYRIAHEPGVVVWAWGLGVGSARPTRWTVIHTNSNINVLNAASGTWSAFAQQTGAALAYQTTALALASGYLGCV